MGLTTEEQERLRNEVTQVYLANYGWIPSDEEVNLAIAVLTLGGNNPFFTKDEALEASLTNKLGRRPILEEMHAARVRAEREAPFLTLSGRIVTVCKFVEGSQGHIICDIPYPVPSASIGEELPMKGEN